MIAAYLSYVENAVAVPLTIVGGVRGNMSYARTSIFILIAIIIGSFILLMIAYPAAVLAASSRGLAIWWDVLFPSLLPFFVVSEMLFGFGIVHFIGTLLDPIMRPLFCIPGIGGFVLAMGYASGYPVGAKLTTRLRLQRLITREEGERLIAFTTSSDPIFLIGAVSIGFFGDARLAATIAVAHYGTTFLIGLLMRFHAPNASMSPLSPLDTSKNIPIDQKERHKSILVHAFWTMHEARKKDGRSLSTLLQEAVASSLQLVIVVGGLVVIFSVIMDLLSVVGVMQIGDRMVQHVLRIVHLPTSLSAAFSSGIFEVTLGAKDAGAADSAGTWAQVVAATWILSWGGLSVHAQIFSIMNLCDFRYVPFLLSRLAHSFLAAIAAFALYPLLSKTNFPLPAWLSPIDYTTNNIEPWERAWFFFLFGLQSAAIFVALLCVISAVVSLFRPRKMRG